MAFSGLTWPTLTNPLLNGLKVQLDFPVAVAGNGTYEYRAARSAYARRTWTFPTRSLLDSDRNLLISLWSQVGGSLNSFLFQDPDNNSFTAVNIGTGTQINPPAAPTVTTSTTGGTIAASTLLTYGVTALNAQGESTESGTTNITTGSTTATNSNTISWTAVTGATSYNIYQGGKLIGNTTALTFTDTGYPQGAAAPTVNGTGTQNYPLLVPMAGILHPIWHPSGLTVNGSGTGFTFTTLNGQPVVQFPAGSCPAYGIAVTASAAYQFAVRFTASAGYALNVVGTTSGYNAVSFTEVFE